MQITIFTLFPHWFDGPLGESVIDRARQKGILSLKSVNFRDYATDKHNSVDGPPYGGGGGMVLRPEPICAALDEHAGKRGDADRAHVIYLSPKGRRFDQRMAIELAQRPRLALVCGHYEALDQRVIDSRVDEEVSLGDFVMTGGEIAAMAIVDAVARMIPGTLGNDSSALTDSFMNGLLEGPHFTRPEVFEGAAIPPVLTSGNHAAVATWREEQSLAITRERRPELYDGLALEPETIRRLARRARPFAVFRRRNDALEVLFASAAIRRLPDWQERLLSQRSKAGLPGTGWRWVEFTDLQSGDEIADRRILAREAEASARQESSPRPFWLYLRESLRAQGINPTLDCAE
ncbi:tRNA (guanosine(37)-N1)-methyltransferase TrmD [bacterium]|nr:tRNA (guanosine(37)-N1)-methyltransferase TrmD [bacterium]